MQVQQKPASLCIINFGQIKHVYWLNTESVLTVLKLESDNSMFSEKHHSL